MLSNSLRVGRILQSILLLTPLTVGAAVEWRPIEPAELSQKTPKVDPAADAEIIFWDVKVEDRVSGVDVSLILSHYVRIKIFTDRGKEKYSTVEIEQIGRRRVTDVAGRTIKADGTTVDLKKDSVFVRDLAKTKGFKARGTTFALPNVEVGDIIEYRYRELRDDEVVNYMPLYLQREIPIWNVTYHVKPIRDERWPYAMRSIGFHANNSAFKSEGQGFFYTTMENVPGIKTEPLMPPEDAIRSWVLIYYEEDKKINADKYWKDLGREDWNAIKPLIKVDDSIKKAAAEITASGKDDWSKLQLLDGYCRTKIKNVYSEEAEMTSAERKGVKENRHPSDTLRQMAGTPTDINLLFTALASAAGFDARFARIPDRGQNFFHAEVPIRYFMRNRSVAVKVGDAWKFFDPATAHLQPGMLRWQEEDQQALISDPKSGFFTQTQMSLPIASAAVRKADLKLGDDGTIEGKIEYIFTGHLAAEERDRYENMTPAQIEESWKDRFGQYGTPSITGFEMKQKDDPSLPLIVSATISAPQYCARTNKRILLEPGFFEHNLTARFPEATRKWDVYFHFPFSENDDVTIELPDGWTLDQPTAPASSKLSSVGNYVANINMTKDGRKVIYTRKFTWAEGGMVLFPAPNYAIVKKIFDFVQEQDHHVLTLKQGGSAGATSKN